MATTTRSAAASAAALLLLLLLAAAALPPRAAAAEKETHLRVYWHDVVSGPNPTAVTVARAAATNASATGFGAVVVIDDPLTEGPELNSTLVGRAQGVYVSAGKDAVGLLMAMDFVLTAGEHNGSTIAIMGRNAVFSAVREMSVIGGSGTFRWARGYVQARTHTLDLNTGDATVEYNVFVRHP